VNKAQLIDELAQRLGDKRTAGAAVDGLVDVIVRTVHKGEKVSITGFGVFERRARAARTARNPRTGETVRVRKTNVPAFRAGTTFKDVISGAKKLPRAAGTGGAGAATASKPATKKDPAKKASSKKAPSKKK
jgi:DNA-binding protein HU-beta